ncbi:MAG TPA: ATP-binding protein [Polyangiaceae bacterium]
MDTHRRASTDIETTNLRHQHEHDLILEVSQAVSSSLELDVVLQIIADGTARLAGVETAAVYVFDGDQLFLGATTPPLDVNVPETLRWASIEEHPHIREAARSRLPVVLPDALRAELSAAERAVVESRNLRSLLFLPFCLEQQPIGVLILGTTTFEHVFDAHEVNLCRTITNQLAVSVQNATLHTRLKRYAAELERQMAEQKLLEERLRQAQKMEAIGQLAGGVAHDFNNLLQVIQGFTGIARDEVEPDSDTYESLGFVLQATERAGLLVRQLLAFGRRQVLSLSIVDLNQIVAGLMPMLRPLLGENISVECRSAAELDLIEADPNQIEQVLINLCVNARDAMPSGGTVIVETRSLQVDESLRQGLSLAHAGAYVVLTVKDSGCGMTREIRARVFEPFFTTKAPGQGTGLGLATVHGLVAQHHGAVHIDSELGQGTSVEVYLPVAAAGKRGIVAVREVSLPRGTETILVAEDEPLVLELTRATLVAAGYKVFTAADGQEALDVIDAQSDELDLAVLDVVMPKVSGEIVLHRLRERRPEFPVVFASGYGWNLSSHERHHKRTAFLQKPFGREDLLRKVRKVLEGAT